MIDPHDEVTDEDHEAIDGVMEGDLDFEEVAGRTNCPGGCQVEPDGVCPHGWKALALRAMFI